MLAEFRFYFGVWSEEKVDDVFPLESTLMAKQNDSSKDTVKSSILL